MNSGIYVALSGSITQENQMDTITNNISNMNTTGYKKENLVFQTFLDESENEKISQEGNGMASQYLSPPGLFYDMSQGALFRTGGDLDLALEGDGFFVVETPQGQMLTRNGAFKLGTDGSIQTSAGHKLLSESGSPFFINSGRVVISAEGEVSLIEDMGDGEQPFVSSLGKIKTIDVEEKNKLVKKDSGIFSLKNPKDKIKLSLASIRQGFLERSNVDAVREMTKLITATRGVSTYQKVIQSFDEIQRTAIEQIGRV